MASTNRKATAATGVVPIEKAMNASGAAANQKAMGKIRAKIIGQVDIPVTKAKGEPGASTAVPQDPFHSLSVKGTVIEPPFDMLTLAMLPEHSTEMEQCIEAMEINIEGFGHRMVPRVKAKDGEELPDDLAKKVHKEKVKLINFFQYATRESFTMFRRKLRKDLEGVGNAYFEVIRDSAGQIQSFVHLPAYQMRLGRLESDQQLCERKILELQMDGSVKVSTIKEWVRRRVYVQSKSVHLRNLSTVGGHKMRWFKEFGDQRIFDNRNGNLAKSNLELKHRANEVVHLKLYSARTPYGLPRYIGNMLSIFGDRAAEEINYMTFSNNNIPSMVVMVSNGQLTEGSIQRIESFVESQIQGSDNYSKFLLLEAEGLMEGEESGAHSKVEIKPLTQNQHKDALFQNYSDNNQDKIRRVWRLPPIFVGRTDDYTRSTAESSRVLADEQIFAPERDEWDELMNRIIFPEMGIIYHKYKTNTPNTTDNTQLVKILGGAEKTGGMTPRIARVMLEDILSVELPDFPKDFPADIPFSLTMAEAVKNKAEPTEPGQQLTALKRLWDVDDDVDEPYVIEAECSNCGATELVSKADQGDPLVEHLLRMNKRLEKRWQQEIVKANEEAEATEFDDVE